MEKPQGPGEASQHRLPKIIVLFLIGSGRHYQPLMTCIQTAVIGKRCWA